MAADFYYEVKKAKKNRKDLPILLTKWRGHPRILLDVSDKPIFIARRAAYKSSENGQDSLEDIFVSAGKLDREIPFACLIDTRAQVIEEAIRGSIGTFGLCDWHKGKLLPRAYTKARERKLKIMLGHTHPQNYGPVCSNIQRPQDGPFGGDFTEMWEMMKQSSLISEFHIIMTPRDNQIGVFELKRDGRVIYHPLLELETKN